LLLALSLKDWRRVLSLLILPLAKAAQDLGVIDESGTARTTNIRIRDVHMISCGEELAGLLLIIVLECDEAVFDLDRRPVL
jgi:hypothetical protein